MIIKSMSRKEATFGQLMEYIDRDGGGERFRIRHNLLGRDRERIREEFETNAEHMRKRPKRPEAAKSDKTLYSWRVS